MIFADKRYARRDKQDKLPLWITEQLKGKNFSLSIDMAVQLANAFFKEMGQPFKMPQNLLLSSEAIAKRQAEEKV